MPKHPQIKSKKQREIEQEFGCSFREVLVGFAELGYGCDTTAKILGYDTSTFRSLLNRRGWTIPWPPLSRQRIMRDRPAFSDHTRRILSQRAKEREQRKREMTYVFPSDQDRADNKQLDAACTQLEIALEDLDYAKQALYDLGLQPDDTVEEYRAMYLGGSGRGDGGTVEQSSEDAGQSVGDSN